VIGLIDGDLVAHRCAASAENDGEDIAILRADRLMRELIEATGVDSYRVFLTGANNFRREVDPEYKANRKGKPLPIYLNQCKEFLVTEWKAEVTDGIEADDALGINQTDETIIISLDKDLLMIPGKHYQWPISGPNWHKDAKFLEVSEFDGLKSFYISSLVGDKSDNIIGVAGIGPVKAERAVSYCETEQQLFDTCRELYGDDERYFRNLKLLWILQEEGEVFDPIKRGLLSGTLPTEQSE
jgi:5'-3' exonuclease